MGSFRFANFLQSLYDAHFREGMFAPLYEMIKDEKSLDLKKGLLLQACLFYDRSKVKLEQQLIKAVFAEFKFVEQELGQCLGFLFLLYENNSAAFSQLSLPQVIELENEVPTLPLQLQVFLKQFLSPYVKPFFPATLLCLTPPLIRDIQERGGKALFYDVPSEFLIDHIDILVYSFEANIDQFNDYVGRMQQLYISHYLKLRYYQFQRALSYVVKAIKSKDQRWMCNLRKVGDYLSMLANDVILSKETHLTQEIVEAAGAKDGDFMESIPNQRLKKQAQVSSEAFWLGAKELNQANDNFLQFLENFELDHLDKSIELFTQYLKIDKLLPIQQLCLSYILHRRQSMLSVVGIGHGKTILCNLLAAYLATTSAEQVIVLNKQKNLSMRNGILFDETLGRNLKLVVGFEGVQRNEEAAVIFMCDDELQQYLQLSQREMNEVILIIDEADQVLMCECTTNVKEKELHAQRDKLLFYSQAKSIFAFTGTVNNLELQCMEEALGAEIIFYPQLSQVKQHQNVQLRNEEFTEKEAWFAAIVKEVATKHMQVPILILAGAKHEKELITLVNQSLHASVNIISLNNKKPLAINGALKDMNVFDEKCGYPVALIDEALCRGLDVKTSPEIEKNGGIYVIIAKVPSSRKNLEQALGRTQRLIYKGQHSILVHKSTAKKSLEQQLKDAGAKIEFNMRQLLQLLKASSKISAKKMQMDDDHVMQDDVVNEELKKEDVKEELAPRELSGEAAVHKEIAHKEASDEVVMTASHEIHEEKAKGKSNEVVLKLTDVKQDYKILFGDEIPEMKLEEKEEYNGKESISLKTSRKPRNKVNVAKKRTHALITSNTLNKLAPEESILSKENHSHKRRKVSEKNCEPHDKCEIATAHSNEVIDVVGRNNSHEKSEVSTRTRSSRSKKKGMMEASKDSKELISSK